MTNPWQNIETGKLYNALLSRDPEQALKDLVKAKRVLQLSANRARIKAGKKLMNAFHRKIIETIRDYQADFGKDYREELKQNDDFLYDLAEELKGLIFDYMEYCYD